MLNTLNSATRPTTVRRWLPRMIGIAAVLLAGALLYRALRGYSLDAIVASVRAIPVFRFALALAFAAASYGCLTIFDWLATRYVGAKLSYGYVALTSFC